MVDHLDLVVIGAGVVGLAIARALAQSGRDITILEKHAEIGSGTSSRNSEVIHAGIYYPKGSLKSLTCIEGNQRLYTYCRDRNIPYKNCGKLIVATNADEAEHLNQIIANAQSCGVDDLVLLDQSQTLAREPELNAVASIFSPSTGIIDCHTYMHTLLGDIENAGGQLVKNSHIVSGSVTEDGFALTLADGYSFTCNALINAAGLDAHNVCANLSGFPAAHIPKQYLAKGSYFTLSGQSPFAHLIYPVPVPGGLGTHLTMDMGGQARFGPNVKWVEQIDYDIDPDDIDAFYRDIQNYWPDIRKERLQPGYAGIRPKLVAKGQPSADFLVQNSKTHGIPNLVNLFGIESPGLTASLPLANIVTGILNQT